MLPKGLSWHREVILQQGQAAYFFFIERLQQSYYPINTKTVREAYNFLMEDINSPSIIMRFTSRQEFSFIIKDRKSPRIIGGLARYSVHFTATMSTKLLHHCLFMSDLRPQAQNGRIRPSFPMVQVVSSGFQFFTQ